MNIESFDWDLLYSKVEAYLSSNGIHNATVCRNQRTVFGDTAIVRVNIPQKGNKQEIAWLKKNKYCYKCAGMNANGNRIFQFGIRASELN
uniref:hypothetical protein n=1 Tax=Acetatifactor sp. TaxID=1872090 RepID=UPI00405681D4